MRTHKQTLQHPSQLSVSEEPQLAGVNESRSSECGRRGRRQISHFHARVSHSFGKIWPSKRRKRPPDFFSCAARSY